MFFVRYVCLLKTLYLSVQYTGPESDISFPVDVQYSAVIDCSHRLPNSKEATITTIITIPHKIFIKILICITGINTSPVTTYNAVTRYHLTISFQAPESSPHILPAVPACPDSTSHYGAGLSSVRPPVFYCFLPVSL